MPISQHQSVNGFLDYLRFEKRFSQHTIRSYSDDLASFFDFLVKNYGENLPEISPFMIRSWMAEMASAGMAPRSINRKLSCLKSFFRYCRRTGLTTVNPASVIQVMKVKKRLPSYVEEKQMDVLLNHVEFEEGLQGLTRKLIIDILYSTGIRVSELVNIRQHHIDFSHKTLKVLGKGNKERVIPLNPALLESFRHYTEEKKKAGIAEQDYILVNAKGKKLVPRVVYDMVKSSLSLVTTAEKKSPHVLRHSFATHLTNNGADLNAVKELLGHSSLAATQVYTHNSIEKLRDIHRKAHPRG